MTVCLEMVRVLFVGTVTQLSSAVLVGVHQVSEVERTSLESKRLAGDEHNI